MILFFESSAKNIIAVGVNSKPDRQTLNKLSWLFSGAVFVDRESIAGTFIGPRKEMITPWSTNAVEITINMGINGIFRIEEFIFSNSSDYDPMLQRIYKDLDQNIFTINRKPEPVIEIKDIDSYNQKEGLALSSDEVNYLEELSKRLERNLTDGEIFGFSQVNSEHCRHKIFNGKFIIDGIEKPKSLFQLIKLTTETNLNKVVSAYKDNCAFLSGPTVEQFAPKSQNKADYFEIKDIESIISIKAETHNFPTTVEPFNGAATGSGGEIRDRVAGGKGAFPLAGTAVYMTSYPRLEGGRTWEKNSKERKWLYQTPGEILIKASNGASDFGNKFGQPLICGSVLTFEHTENNKNYGFDKVIMLAGGIGYGYKKDTQKDTPDVGDTVVLLGGDNYRIGMGGGSVSSVATGEFENAIELNAVQRSNPEMQKRVCNAIRALSELDNNPIVSIHDHGAGGHLNCLSELVEETGGKIHLDKLPVGDPTLSAKELIGNESQERMGLILKSKDTALLKEIAERERAPMYEIGETTGDHQFTFENEATGEKPLDLKLEDMFGNPPKTILEDKTSPSNFSEISFEESKIEYYIEQLLQLEAVACKDWLTSKVDRCVTGKISKQQTAGEIQLPLNNLGVTAIDYQGVKGVATSIGHAPVAALADPAKASVLSIAEALTNIIWAPIEGGLRSISLSANWMWPAKNEGENYRLYEAVQAASDFAIAIGINIPTGKDSLSMTQKYPNGDVVYAPGTVIISAAGEVANINKVVEPILDNSVESKILYINFSNDSFKPDGSSFAQILNTIGKDVPTITDATKFAETFSTIQRLISEGKILSGHDIGSGGLITSLLEMTFANEKGGIELNFEEVSGSLVNILFSENPGIIIQVDAKSDVEDTLRQNKINFNFIGKTISDRSLIINQGEINLNLDINKYRDLWFKTSYLLDTKQCGDKLAKERFEKYKTNKLTYKFPENFTGSFTQYGIDSKRRTPSGIKAAIIREKGVNGDREMAYAMYLAGMDVKDVHMTDLVSGRETLEDINFIVFVGGFSNSDVLGSAKGWAGAFLYNPKAKMALDNFYARGDTMSLGVCNGCQLMMELNLIHPKEDQHPKMLVNDSHKFECSFLNVDIPENDSIMLKSFSGSKLGIWVAHGEGKFTFSNSIDNYNVAMKYSHSSYPANPNGSEYDVAGIYSSDGRHLAIMPHLERSTYPWNWAHYPSNRTTDEVSPWIEAFVNAREWIKKKS